MKRFNIRTCIILCLLLACALLVSACSGDDKGGTTAETTSAGDPISTKTDNEQGTSPSTGVTTTEKPATETEKPATETEKPVTETEKPVTQTDEPVIEPPIYIFDISSYSETLEEGEMVTLIITVSPDKTFDVSWNSSDESVASVENGVVTAKKAGKATITALVECNELTCEITVNAKPVVTEPVIAAASSADAEGALDLTAGKYKYWEHFGRDGEFTRMLGADDIINAGEVEALGGEFFDYRVAFTWTNGDDNRSYYNNTNGRFGNDGYSFSVKLPKGSSEILVYVGAWRATNTVSLSYNGKVIAEAEPFTAGDASVNKLVSFKVNCDAAREVTVNMDPSDVHDGGNISITAILIPGSPSKGGATVKSLDKTPMNSNSEQHIDLTEKGKIDWIYFGNFDEKDGADSILADTVTSNDKRGGGDFSRLVDYRASFGWSDGTTYEYAPADDDCDHFEIDGNTVGTNDGIFGTYVSASVKVTSKCKHLYVYSTGWDAEYKVAVIDSKGNILFYETVDYKAPGDTRAYELDFTLDVKSNETLTVVVYRLDGSNCGMAAIALS